MSILRIGLAAALPVAPAGTRLTIVFIAGVTDFLDGQIARRCGATSAIGGLLDAIADKLFTLSAVLTLAVAHNIEPWQSAVALTRDAAVLLAFGVALTRGRASVFVGLAPLRVGKWATAAFFLWFVVEFSPAPEWAGWAAFAPAGVLSLCAGASYARALVGALRRDRAE